VAEVRGGEITTREMNPEQAGLPRARAAGIAPGASPAENAALLRAVLSGERGPRRDIILLNAAAALLAAGAAPDLPASIRLAEASLDTGAALAKLDALISLTNQD